MFVEKQFFRVGIVISPNYIDAINSNIFSNNHILFIKLSLLLKIFCNNISRDSKTNEPIWEEYSIMEGNQEEEWESIWDFECLNVWWTYSSGLYKPKSEIHMDHDW